MAPWPHRALAGRSGEGRALGQSAPWGTPGATGGAQPSGAAQASQSPQHLSHSAAAWSPPGCPTPLAPRIPAGSPIPADSPLRLPQSRDRKVLGDYSGALSYGSTAKYLNITALVINVFLIALIIALLATGTIAMVNIFNQQKERYPFHGPT